MITKSDKVFVNMQLTAKLLERIDDYRFSNRIQSRSEAMRQLLAKGLGTKKPKK